MIPVCEPSFGLREYYNVFRALRSNWLTCGKFTEEFEQKVTSYHKAKYGVALSSGTAALHMALLALGIGKGNEVIVPSLSFVAVASMVKLVGATPVIVDINKDDWLINPGEIRKAITNKTRAIIPVHLYGSVCNMLIINTLASYFNIPVIEDTCEAIGTPLNGTISCLSFQSTKTITTCGEGGMCITSNKKIADRIQYLKNHAMTPDNKYYHTEVGLNYRMTAIQAAFGLAQLSRLNGFIGKKEQIYLWYREMLNGTKNITFQKYIGSKLHWVTTILVNNRDILLDKLASAGIESRVMFTPIHLMLPYRQEHDCPIATDIASRGLYLPSGVNLKKSQIKYICEVIKEHVSKN